MMNSKSISASGTLTFVLALVLMLGMFVGMSSEVNAKSILAAATVNVEYKAGSGPANVTLAAEKAEWQIGTNTLAAAPTTTDKNFTFIGWKDTSATGAKNPADKEYYNAADTVTLAEADTGSREYTAVWGYKVTYMTNLDGVTVKDTNGTAISGTTLDLTDPLDYIEYNVDNPLPQEASLTAEGYTFIGWSYTQQSVIPKSTTVADKTKYAEVSTITKDKAVGPVTLYAVWQADFFKVTYYANTGNDTTDSAVTGLPVDTTKYMGTNLKATIMGNGKLASDNANKATMTDGTPTRSGYTFAGWSTSKTATAADSNYAPGTALANPLTADLDLYAVWTTGTTAASNGTAASNAATTKTPQTGDNDHLTLYIALALFSLLGIGYLCYDQRKAKATK